MNDLNVKKGFEWKEKTFIFSSKPIYRSLSSSPVKHQQSTSSDLNKYLPISCKLNRKKKKKKKQQVKQAAKMTATNVRLSSLFAMLITLLLNISTAKQASGKFSS